ncbi:monosaccharide ABC transporter ATP-binding protein (CUT2 family) [Rhizobium sp. PP-F2F-G38]|uniref:Sugar ABC transporter ATP-binding protein n=1 Tax=Ferranicluibacter rubi TaxID=2715133 RepID=A0AA43ZDB9_9HYPH|nr:sugar ABC transporter ATP-binding protein [Ferranicluibacter rubi]PYE32592.1 monosaccharide ABC transporter ATP-binding protein (CUT2 family) [Rhizobium sp. PP-WC-1G-195]PYE96021.1 monosaccharide ABC transporter ATP-binding protein (CUT2 family) [Rhizobium sp. PP-F2F-G38]TCP88374.1 monosaccharide ABC transporter ATP-binding protein (CUT2 family) [Rhizobium sp. PP-CC-2G-626]TCQ22961.1 monosaccharide ABC transporter ATP-binding protein (CUT2 family) [Rhizobium sp. PP-CC-3G-465]NHT75730.1 suga
MTQPVLSLRGISKHYGPLQVLRSVSLDVHPGEVVALLGENGAGKSTLSGIIAGSRAPSEGTMTWLGQPYAPATPREAIDKGVVLIHQELKLLPQLSIAENVFIGRWPTRNGAIDRAQMERRAQEQLSRLNLHIPASRKVAGLSTANQQLIEIAKALALDAKLLILDEPTAALGGAETEALFEQVRKLRAEGVGIIYISHRMEEIKQITDRIVVLRDGERVQEFADSATPVRTVVESMVGRSLDRLFPPVPTPTERPVLQVSNLTSAVNAFRDVSFEVRAGEILGIAGLVGAGRTELVRAIAGADPVKAGTIRLDGQVLKLRDPADAIAKGIVLVPEDRKDQGLVVAHKISENLIYANLDKLGGRWITAGVKKAFAEKAIAKFNVKGRAEQHASDLSGGNQQKIVIAKWLMRDPKVVVLDEPTRGIDVGARAGIYDIIVNLAWQGVAVIVVSSDLEEVLGVSNRILVLAQGNQAGILNREQANDVSVMELATI